MIENSKYGRAVYREQRTCWERSNQQQYGMDSWGQDESNKQVVTAGNFTRYQGSVHDGAQKKWAWEHVKLGGTAEA